MLCYKVLASYSKMSYRILGTESLRYFSCDNKYIQTEYYSGVDWTVTFLTILYRYYNHEMHSNIIAANTVSLKRISSVWKT